MSDSQPIYLGVIGKPILQSLSPTLHQEALKRAGKNGVYLRLAVDSLKEALVCADEMGLKGLNITAPFKEEALTEEINLDREVSQVGAANTLVFGQQIATHNTDIYGVLRSLGLANQRSDGKTALIIGAGGAAKAAAYALKQNGCRVFICNRTPEKAQSLATKFGINQISHSDAALLLKNTDYLLNTVFSTEELLDLTHLQSHTLILDAIYARQTPFSESCSNNPNYINGKTWLFNQGIRAFELFTGVKTSDSHCAEILSSLFTKAPPAPHTISLIGMMGSGKSSVGRSLGSILDNNFVDLDDVVEQTAGCTIAKLVAEQGEETFRKLESQCLAQVLETKPRVLSCGGGIIGTTENRTLLRDQTTPVWLWASKEELLKRLAKFSHRPLLLGQDLPSRVSELLDQRFEHYAKVSQLVVTTKDRTVTEVAKRIAFEVINGH